MVSVIFAPNDLATRSTDNGLPKNRKASQTWLTVRLSGLRTRRKNVVLDPSIVAFRDLVDNDPLLKQLSQDMFTQIPPAYTTDPVGNKQVQDFDELLFVLNDILKQGPQWFYISEVPTAMGLIGAPINAVLNWPMGTEAGYAFFRFADVNQQIHSILSTWGNFLASPASAECLNSTDGWLSPVALKQLSVHGSDNGPTYSFDQLYECDQSLPNYGFQSWDAFFTRKFRVGMRPVHFPDSEQPQGQGFLNSAIILHSCESVPLRYSTGAQLHDRFWVKEQPYSLANMLDNDPYTLQFVGGSVYQAFLSALTYHRWHAPVSGTVLSTRVIPGTYFSENVHMGFRSPNPDPKAAENSQPYISAVATRGIMFIQADNPAIGLMAIIYIGMAEVSSCVFSVGSGDRLVKGETETGAFHYGGSSYVMVFRPSTKLSFLHSPPWRESCNRPVNSALAHATSQ